MSGDNTDWRQGDLLTPDSAAALLPCGATQQRAVVISHDCDLASSREHCVELIVAHVLDTVDGNHTNARNPRTLHLEFVSNQRQRIALELRHSARRQIRSWHFRDVACRDDVLSLEEEGKRILKRWLTARYGRPAFPDAFESRLRKTVGRRTVADKIAHITRSVESRHVLALYFDLGERRDTDLPDGEPYELRIVVVYDGHQDASRGRMPAEQIASELAALFEDAYGPAPDATEIALDSCEALPDTRVTLADIRRMLQWRLEYISLRDSAADVLFPDGESVR